MMGKPFWHSSQSAFSNMSLMWAGSSVARSCHAECAELCAVPHVCPCLQATGKLPLEWEAGGVVGSVLFFCVSVNYYFDLSPASGNIHLPQTQPSAALTETRHCCCATSSVCLPVKLLLSCITWSDSQVCLQSSFSCSCQRKEDISIAASYGDTLLFIAVFQLLW